MPRLHLNPADDLRYSERRRWFAHLLEMHEAEPRIVHLPPAAEPQSRSVTGRGSALGRIAEAPAPTTNSYEAQRHDRVVSAPSTHAPA